MCLYRMYEYPGRAEDAARPVQVPETKIPACVPDSEEAVFYDLVVELVASGVDWP